MRSRILISGDIALTLTPDEAEMLLAEQQMLREVLASADEFGPTSDRLIAELKSCVDEEEDEDDEDDDDEEIDDDDSTDSDD